MELKQLIADDDAVSPVIGVILMVAITVILAAVIGTFVLGIGQDQQSTPQAQFDFEFNGSGGVTVSHQGGDQFTSENTGSSGAACAGGATGLSVSADNETCWSTSISAGGTSPQTATSPNTEVEVLWEAPGGGDSQILAETNTPS